MDRDQAEEIGQEIPQNVVSVYGQDSAYEDFPVLKAFQQYIDAEQDKARKRLLSLAIFFGIMMLTVIGVFVLLLKNANDRNLSLNDRNQTLNDRLVEFAIKERDAQKSQVVVQPAQDNAAVVQLTSQLAEMQKKLMESQHKADLAEMARKNAEDAAKKSAQDAEKTSSAAAREIKAIQDATKAEIAAIKKAAAEAAKPKGPTAEEIEIQQLKALLAEKKAKDALKAEAERKREAELEAYRRKHYPNYYAKKLTVSGISSPQNENPKPAAETKSELISTPVATPATSAPSRVAEEREEDTEDAVTYFEEEDEEEKAAPPSRPSSPAPAPAPVSAQPEKKKYSIPVKVKGSSSAWEIPNL